MRQLNHRLTDSTGHTSVRKIRQDSSATSVAAAPRPHRWRTTLSGLLCAALLAACSGGESRVDSGNRDGILHFGNGTEPQGIDPHATTGIPERNIQLAVFEGLTHLDSETLVPKPAAAESWTVSDDGLTYRFTLQENGRWSNGDPVTAEDFRWSFWRAMQPALGNLYVYMFFPILNAEAYISGELTDFDQVGIRALDARTLEVELKAPTPYFLQLLDHHSMYPVHPATVKAFGGETTRFTKWTRPGNIVTNGPFQLTEWRLNKRVVVEPNPFYWDADSVRLNGIVFYPTENLTTEERMFRVGQLHTTNEIPLYKIPTYRDSDVLVMEPYLGSYHFEFNITKPPLDDRQVRRALALAIDRKTLTETVMYGIVEPAYAITPPGTIGYYPPKLLDYDPEEARQLLAAAGFPDGEGFPVVELLYNTSESHRKLAVAIQQMWKEVLNIDISLVNQEWKVYLNSRDTLSHDIARAGWIGDYVDPNSFLDMFLTDSGNNRTGWSNAEYDRLILEEIPNIADPKARNEAFFRAETILMDELPVIPIYTYSTKYLKHPSVKGMPPNLMDHYSFKNVYLEPEAS